MTELVKKSLIGGVVALLLGAAVLLYTIEDNGLGIFDRATPTPNEQIENLSAFAKLYGYVRWFHPSDAAAETDWDKFAIYGARQVKDATSRAELRSNLNSLFAPIAPTLQLYPSGTNPPDPPAVLTSPDTAGLRLVAWQHEGVGFEENIVPERFRFGMYESIRLHRPPGRSPLFGPRPTPGEVVNRPLGRGLSAQVPLALYSRDGETLRPDDAPSPEVIRDSTARLDLPILETSEPRRLGSVVITWSVLQHFYPYFEVVDTNWNEVLSPTLRRALRDTSKRDFLYTLRRMVAQLEDGHGTVRNPTLSPQGSLPLRFARVERQVVVLDTAKSARENLCPQIGDVVISIDGVHVDDRIQSAKQYISGSPQWKEYQALQHLGRGQPRTSVDLKLQRDGSEIECSVRRHSRFNGPNKPTRRPDPLASLPEGIRYVDLTRATWSEIQAELDALARAEAVIFDLRGYPEDNNNGNVLGHLSGDSLRQMRVQIPQFIYPDQKDLVGYKSIASTDPPQNPRITGEAVFLTNARARSAPEGVLAVVKHYDLATIVGRPTAGANGGVNPFTLPGRYQIFWTGMRVRKHDGSQHHLIGIQPDVRVDRSLEGVQHGRDEYLKTAMDLLRKKDT